MKKAWISFFCALLCCAFSIFSNEIEYVSAEEITLESIDVKENYYVEIRQEAIALPQLLLDENWSFTLDLFAQEDDSYQAPLAESAEKFQFKQIGQYRLRYTVYSLNDETQFKVLYSTLNVVDTIAPQLELQYLYKDKVCINSWLIISDAYVFDNSGEENIPFQVKAYLNDKEITSKISDGKLYLSEVGDLRLHYVMADSSGNQANIVYEIAVVEQQEESSMDSGVVDSGCKSMLGVGESALLLLSGAFFVMKKKKRGGIDK